MHWGNFGYGMGFGSGYGMGIGGIIMILIVLGFVGLTVYLITEAARAKGTKPAHHESPIDIIKERYARGEITKQEFDRLRNDLK